MNSSGFFPAPYLAPPSKRVHAEWLRTCLKSLCLAGDGLRYLVDSGEGHRHVSSQMAPAGQQTAMTSNPCLLLPPLRRTLVSCATKLEAADVSKMVSLLSWPVGRQLTQGPQSAQAGGRDIAPKRPTVSEGRPVGLFHPFRLSRSRAASGEFISPLRHSSQG